MPQGINFVSGDDTGPRPQSPDASQKSFLLKAFAGTGAVQLAGMLATFLVGIQLARGLGVEGYGQYGIAMSVIAIAAIPGEFGIPRLVLRESAAAAGREDWSGFFGVLRWADSACWKIAAAIALAIIAGTVLLIDHPTSGIGAAILWGTPIIPLIALAKIRGATLQGLHYVVLGQVPPLLLRPLLLALLLFAFFALEIGISADQAMALNSLTAAASLLVVHAWLRRRLPADRPEQVVETGRQWLSSSFAMGLAGGIRILQAQLLILLLGLLGTTTDVGLFRIAASTALMVATPITIVQLVASPTIARLYGQNDLLRLQKLATRSAQAQIAGVLILSLPFMIAGESIVALVFGAEYEPAAGPLRLLLAGHIVNAAFGVNSLVLSMTKYESRVVRTGVIALVLGMAAIAVLAPLWGQYGAATAFIVSMTAWNVLAWRDAKRLAGVETLPFLLNPKAQ